ncbi:aromatic amino acid transaminase [Gallaecimonas pentaromativorans]|uniref:Aspartate aminotransferase n=1 Tax=Gallaecimonas pentaromativorans TaxID=584787 RepID=A0A3N1PFP7_9GAMM|nr:amino acid aminotransferase [Gallaecimonas pentaromativorans]ROQ27423.1 aspartate aminotransferase [Gallaecimonas pentaromativorans]
MFESLQAVPADPILGLSIAYKNDENPSKVDLGVGVYKTETGETPILKSVALAQRQRIETETTKTYIGSAGDAGFNDKLAKLVFGEGNPVLARQCTVSTPGGTGALRMAAEFIKRCNPGATIWVTDPTWANHNALFNAAGIQVKSYRYFDKDNSSVDFAGMMDALQSVPKGDVVLLHACCHNPSGADLNQAQWLAFAELAKEKGFTPLIDMAYQGFGDGLDEDAFGPRTLAATLPEFLLTTSGSKNFGLYRERIGALTLVGENSTRVAILSSVIQNVARCIYSMPPAHGAAIIDIVLGSTELTELWKTELAEMRGRIHELRSLLVDKLHARQDKKDFSFITKQYGMFSFLGISKEQVHRLKDEFSVYMVDSSRMNVAGINHSNVDYLADAITKVL